MPLNKTEHDTKLTPARQRLHLYENHSLIARWVTRDYCLVKLNIFRHYILGGKPLAIATAKVKAKSSSMGNTERVRDT